MAKFFNTAGLCFPEKHYMVDPIPRLTEIENLIKNEMYFTIHAPRQTGKTTYLYALANQLNAERKYIALVASFERAGYGSISVEKANETLIDSVYNASVLQIKEEERPINPVSKNILDLKQYLSDWCMSQTKPIVLLIDEIDALLDDVLISVLRQLRDGYQSRPKAFPSSIALVGLRDVREYKTQIRPNTKSLGTASPFNVKAESIFLNNFNKENVFFLLKEHTKETGQIFCNEAKKEIFNLSNGQPWLVNAIANQIVSKILGNDYSKEITLDIVKEAKNQLILRRDTHLDSLVDKLREPRVKSIVQSIINGDSVIFDMLNDDIVYLRDLGLVSRTSPLKLANPIYAEIIPRIMASPMQETIPEEIQTEWFLNEDKTLNIEKVLKEFQKFYRRNSEMWIERYEYKESAQHLLLMAFLQRVINAGGDIIREMALGNSRIDMLVRFYKEEFAMELKIRRSEESIEEGKEQLDRYLDKLGKRMGYLIIFDPRNLSWEEKIYYKEISLNNKKIIMVGV